MESSISKLKGKSPVIITIITVLFACVNLVAFSKGIWWVSLLPVVLAFISLLFFKPTQFWLVLVFLTPFSIIADVSSFHSSLSLPTEPLVVIMMLLLLIKFLISGVAASKYLKHPISIIIMLYVAWMLITSLFSSMPLVSIKAFISRFWFIVVFFFFGIQVFNDKKNIPKYIWAYTLGLGIVIIYTLHRHSQEFFSHQYSYYAALPFFKDHNIYAVVVAFFIPPLAVMFFEKKLYNYGLFKGALLGFLLGVFTVGVVLSYTRAAWVSLAAAILIGIFMLFRVKLRTLLITSIVGLLILAVSWSQIMLYLSKNKTESDTNLDAHVKSIYNVTSDDSNTERLNRWNAAYRMFLERPVFGWGPNTYQFQYAPFQLSKLKTKISTNQGNLGNAHSEFIGPLAEMGLIGLLLVLALALTALHYGFKICYESPDRLQRYTALFVVLSLVTYYVHGLLNNYLDIDKANVAFWAFFAILVVTDVKRKELMDKQ